MILHQDDGRGGVFLQHSQLCDFSLLFKNSLSQPDWARQEEEVTRR
jgi:hypothetical protein